MITVVDLPWFVSRHHRDRLAQLQALAATPTKRRKRRSWLAWWRV